VYTNIVVSDKEKIDMNLKELLKNGVVEVTFTKMNGDKRVMTCTLQPSFLPEEVETEKTRKQNDDVLSVWDIDANGWRSFRFDSVISYSPKV
jgi:hypothetical protein